MSVEEILAQRGAVYGDFENVAATSQALKRIIRAGAVYQDLSCVQQESLDQIANKLARIVNGGWHADSWTDVAGYSELVLRADGS
jgi:hypothetical protein